MEKEERLKLGDLLIREGIITNEQLEEVLKFQKERNSYTPIGEVCVASGYLTRYDLKALLKKYHKRMRIGEVFQALGLINEKQLEHALALQKEKKLRIGELLVEMGIIKEDHLVEALSSHLDIPRIIPDPSLIDKSLLKGLSKKFLTSNHIIPLCKNNNEVTVIFSDPLADDIVKNLEAHFKSKVLPAIAHKEDIEHSIKVLLDVIETGKLERTKESTEELGKDLIIKDIDLSSDADNTDQGAKTVQIINYIITEAVKSGVSDIHIEPQSSRLRIRYRIDGILHNKTDLPASMAPGIASRIKVLCGLDIAERRRHQDGRIEATVMGKKVDLRISSYASVYGENIVIRILHRHTHLIDLDRLGFSPVNMTRYEKLLNYPSGIILATGPTGSGKTTTLYASLNYLNNKEKMIITVEDPVEYTIDGVVQGKLDPKLGLSYSDFLKSMMRQDPDVIMVGEIRDTEAAEATIQAALTGHKILSSFHTDDTTGALLRLMDMGIDTFLISSTVVSVIAQRLVRMVCNECKEEYIPEKGLLASFQITPDEATHFKFYIGRGCRACSNTGYKGRTGIHELLFVNDVIRDAILARKTSTEIRYIARTESGLISMREDGIYKSIKGLTNLEEVVRVVFHNESDRFRGRPIEEIFNLCEMKEGIEDSSSKASKIRSAYEITEKAKAFEIVPGKEEKEGSEKLPQGISPESPKEISIPIPFTKPVIIKAADAEPSAAPRVDILRVRLNTSEAQSEIDKLSTIFNEYISKRQILNKSIDGMEVEDFIEYIVSQIVRLKVRLNIDFVEVVLGMIKDEPRLYVETVSQNLSKNILMLKSAPIIYERLVEELDFERHIRNN